MSASPSTRSLVVSRSAQSKPKGPNGNAKAVSGAAIAAVKGEGGEQELIDKLVQRLGADQFFTPENAAFIKNPKPSQQDRIQFSWRYECLEVRLPENRSLQFVAINDRIIAIEVRELAK